MKKKIKIFSTIASLCLAITLMAFGVYAASTISFTTSSTLKFTTTEIAGKWTLQVSGEPYEGTIYKSAVTVAEAGASDASQKETTVQNVEDISFSRSDSAQTVTYTVVFTNTGTQNDAYANVTFGLKVDNADDVDKNGWSVSATANSDDYTSGTEIKVSPSGSTTEGAVTSVTFVITLKLDQSEELFSKTVNSTAVLTISGNADTTNGTSEN